MCLMSQLQNSKRHDFEIDKCLMSQLQNRKRHDFEIDKCLMQQITILFLCVP